VQTVEAKRSILVFFKVQQHPGVVAGGGGAFGVGWKIIVDAQAGP